MNADQICVHPRKSVAKNSAEEISLEHKTVQLALPDFAPLSSRRYWTI